MKSFTYPCRYLFVSGSSTQFSDGGSSYCSLVPDTPDLVISSFVGMAVMLLLFPLPGYIAKLVQDVQAQTMKNVNTMSYH